MTQRRWLPQALEIKWGRSPLFYICRISWVPEVPMELIPELRNSLLARSTNPVGVGVVVVVVGGRALIHGASLGRIFCSCQTGEAPSWLAS